MKLAALEKPRAREQEAPPEPEGRLFFAVTTVLGITLGLLAILSVGMMIAFHIAIVS